MRTPGSSHPARWCRLAAFRSRAILPLALTLLLVPQISSAEEPSIARAQFRVPMSEEWNPQKSDVLAAEMKSRAWSFEFMTVPDFEAKLSQFVNGATGRDTKVLQSHLTKNDYSQYYWIFNFKRYQVTGEKSQSLSGSMYEAVYVNDGTNDLGVYSRFSLLNMRDDVDWAFEYSRESPGSRVVFETDEGQVVVNFAGDIYNISKEGLGKRNK